jgi:3-hydroxymyristoyl/3-hydroxydecanoyl-(acyl carrier protein) dehydratase
MNVDITLPMSAESLVPHRPPFLLVDRILEFSGQKGVLECVVRPDNIFLNGDGTFPSLALVELMAQAAAAIMGYSDLIEGKDIKMGFLVDIRQVRFTGQGFKGDTLIIRSEVLRTISGFSIVQGEVKRAGEIIANGTLKLWVKEE